MLTDETIRRIFEEERNSAGLTRLPEDFFEQVKAYMENKSKMAKIEPDRWALDAVKRRLRTIFEMRERKILKSAPAFIESEVLPENMIPEEQKLFEKVVERIREFHREREGKFSEEEEKLVLLTILKDVEKFVGTNLRNYGPFRQGDIATVPEPNAELLLNKGLAEKTEIKE